MNNNDFEDLLVSTLNNENEVREQAESVIAQMKNNNYQLFLEILASVILSTSNPTAFYIALTVILQDVRSNRMFSDIDLFINFWNNNFKVSLAQIFPTGKLNISTCCILSTILSITAIKLPELNIPQILIDSIPNLPHLKCFFIDTLADVFFSSRCRYPFDLLSHLILDDSNLSPDEFNSKFSLLLSIIPHFSANENELSSIFLLFLGNIPPLSIQFVLNSFSERCSYLSSFFEKHINEILIFLSQCISTNDETIRTQSAICLTDLSIEMKKPNDIIPRALLIIMNLMENDENFQFIGRSCIATMANKADSYIFIKSFFDIKSSPSFSIQNSVSYMLSLSEFQGTVSMYLTNFVVPIFDDICIALTGPPKVRFAAFCAIENFCDFMSPIFQEENMPKIFMVLSENLYKESNCQILEMILRCLSEFFRKTSFKETNSELEQIYTYLINMLTSSDIRNRPFQSLIVDLLSNFVKSLSTSFLSQYFPSLIQILSQLVTTNRIDLIVAVIRLCDICVVNITKLLNINPNINISYNEFFPLFQCALELRTRVESESDCDYVSHAIISFINFLGKKISQVLLQVVPSFQNVAAKEIENTHLPEGHQINEIGGFRKVAPNDFLKESTIREIAFALMTLSCIIRALDVDYEPFVKTTMEIVAKWISYHFIICELKLISWSIIDQLLSVFSLDTKIILSLFLQFPFDSNNKVTAIIISALKHGADRGDLDLSFVAKILSFYFANLQQALAKASDDEDEDEEMIIHESEYDMFEFCLNHFPMVTVPFIKEQVIPFIPQLSHTAYTLRFVIRLIPLYIVISKDLSFIGDFINILMIPIISSVDSENAKIAMEKIGFLCDQNQLMFPPEIFNFFYEKIIEILKNKDSFENDSLLFLDEAIIAFSKLIRNHSDLFDMNISLTILFSVLPLSVERQSNKPVIDFLAFLLKEKTTDIINLIGAAVIIKILIHYVDRKIVVDSETNELFKQFIKQYLSTTNPFTRNTSPLTSTETSKLQKILQQQL